MLICLIINILIFTSLSPWSKNRLPRNTVFVSIITQKCTIIIQNRRFVLINKRVFWKWVICFSLELVYQSRTQSSDDGDDDVIEERPITKYKQHMLKDFVLSSAHQKLKMRMVVLRMKMLHVIRSFHFYLMTRVSYFYPYVP